MVKLKRRYLLVEILAEGEIESPNLYRTLIDQVAHLHGDYGVGAVSGSLQVKVHDHSTSIAVLRISSNACHLVTSSLPFVLSVGKTRCVLRLIFEGASMRTVERLLIKRNLVSLYARLRKTKHQGEGQLVQEAICSVTGSRVSHIRM